MHSTRQAEQDHETQVLEALDRINERIDGIVLQLEALLAPPVCPTCRGEGHDPTRLGSDFTFCPTCKGDDLNEGEAF